MQTNWSTLTPAIVMLLVFVSTALGKPISQDDALQLATLIISLIGVIVGIVTNHKKPVVTKNVQSDTQPPSLP